MWGVRGFQELFTCVFNEFILDKGSNFPILMSRFNTAVSLYNNMKGWNRGYRRPVVA